VVKVRIQYMYTINIKHHLLCLCPQVHIINLSSLTNIAKVCVIVRYQVIFNSTSAINQCYHVEYFQAISENPIVVIVTN